MPSPTIFGLPRELWHCTLENFDFTSHAALQPILDAFLESIEKEKGTHLIITGPPGIGKSHLSVSLYREAVELFGTRSAVWKDTVQLCRSVKIRFDTPGLEDPLQEIADARRFIALDDVLGRKLSPWEFDNVLYWAIHKAHMNAAALVVTTNYTPGQLREKLAPHEFDRLFSRSVVVEMRGRSRRI